MTEILKVRSVSGKIYQIATADFDNPAKTLLPFYTSRGNRFTSTIRGEAAFRQMKDVAIHRGNIVEVIK